MNKRNAVQRLADLGFEIDWSVSGKQGAWGHWSGTIDPIGHRSIAGDCRGIALVDCATAAEFYREAIFQAELHSHLLEVCLDPDCEMHAGAEAGEAVC